MILGIPIYNKVNLLDVAGPLEIFHWAGEQNELKSILISEDGGPVTSINGVQFAAHASFMQIPKLDILWVPGGAPQELERIMRDENSPYLEYLRQASAEASWICSVCEGALLLARAGLLDGHRATTHWAFVNCLKKFPAVEVDTNRRRFVQSDNRLTGAGISAGLDEALALICLLFGEEAAKEVQSTTEYFPEPPISAPFPGAMPCRMNWS